MEKILLADLVDKVLNQMQTSGFAESTRKLYEHVYKNILVQICIICRKELR